MEQKSTKELVAEANQQIDTLSAEEALTIAASSDALFVDIRRKR